MFVEHHLDLIDESRIPRLRETEFGSKHEFGLLESRYSSLAAALRLTYWKRMSPLTSISYHINDVSECETINGVPVTEEQIAAWSAEAEAGYDVAALKKRGRGRPGRGAEPSQVIALRLTADEISAQARDRRRRRDPSRNMGDLD
jgi:hypothetical protein